MYCAGRPLNISSDVLGVTNFITFTPQKKNKFEENTYSAPLQMCMYVYDETEVQETILESKCQSSSYNVGIGEDSEIRNCSAG